MARLVRLAVLASIVAAAASATSSVAQQGGGGGGGGESAGEQSAPISNIVYTVTFDSVTAPRHLLRVAMSFSASDSAPVILSLPAWTPGAYEISNFARWVTNFGAIGDGKPLDWDKVDYDTWRIRTGGATSVTVSFDYQADTLDNAMSWTEGDFALINGTNVFLYPEGRGFDFSATVKVRTASSWLVATGMTPTTEPRSYTASNYHDLVDMPFFVGRFDLDSARVADRWMRLATYPVGSVSAAARAQVFEQLEKIVPAQVAVFGDVPWNTYTIMQIADSAYGGISGLEHQNSHVDVTSPFAIGQPLLTSIYAHEIFHAWNVKRLRPADLWPYQYAHEQPTRWLWMSEGITDYYADLTEVRSGVIDSTGFFDLTASKIAEVANTRPVALEDASLSTWVHPVDGTFDIYYPKGSLAGFMLDILIRDASDNRKSLDDVMRELYNKDYKQGRGFTGDEWWGAVSAAAGGKSFAEFNARYVDGREPYPWGTILPLAGLRLVTDTLRTPTLGLATLADSTGFKVSSVDPNSTGAEAGVETGDYLLSVGDIPVSERSFGARFRQKYGTSPGAPVSIRVRRGADTLNLTGKLRYDEHIVVHLQPASNAPSKAVRIRSGILHGRVER